MYKGDVVECISRWVGCNADMLESSDNLADDLGLDSIDIVEIGMEVEDVFSIHIEDPEIGRWKTVQDVVNSVIKQLEEV